MKVISDLEHLRNRIKSSYDMETDLKNLSNFNKI